MGAILPPTLFIRNLLPMILGQEIYGLDTILEKYGLVGFLVIVIGVIAFYLVRSLREMGKASSLQHNKETELEGLLVGLIEKSIAAYSETKVVIDRNSEVVRDVSNVMKSLHDSHTMLISELRDVRQEIAGNFLAIQQQLLESSPANMRIQIYGYNGNILKGTAKTVINEDGSVNLVVEIVDETEEPTS